MDDFGITPAFCIHCGQEAAQVLWEREGTTVRLFVHPQEHAHAS